MNGRRSQGSPAAGVAENDATTKAAAAKQKPERQGPVGKIGKSKHNGTPPVKKNVGNDQHAPPGMTAEGNASKKTRQAKRRALKRGHRKTEKPAVVDEEKEALPEE